MIVDRNFQLDNVVCVISHLYDGDDSPPCDFVRAVDNKFEAVVTRPLKENNDEWVERILGQFDNCNEAVSVIWKFERYEHYLDFWHATPQERSRPQ